MPAHTSASLAEISPFYEPGAPPPTLPILIAQTEVGNIDIPTKLLATEEIGPGPTVSRSNRSKARFAPYSKPSSTRLHSNPSLSQPEDESDLLSLSSDSSEESDDEVSQLIPKPEGEAGRPGCGGYNLERALKWDHKQYQRVKKFIKKLV
ncbi:hypothetical protein CPB83DRAFT_920417 [Crepidotus variabilis]|uniref:Uncharacterized protein n=1 Tax=Crepidotus variabilis TaxID=179855 RepID=A0A9P6E3T3_9AGAR|nr:hypothetical protein CPB83DRAFT_920417 [Crepidotus variabilis]